MLVQPVVADESPPLGVMYQPLNRDAELGSYGWQYLFQQVADTDIEFGVVQWVQYGESDFSTPAPWLLDAVTAWQRHMPLWLGMHSEPDYFTEMAKGTAAQAQFFARYLRRMNGPVARWQGWIAQHRAQFLGWYLPLELSDAYFSEPEQRKQLHEFLRKVRRSMGDAPLAISLFMSAQMSPRSFADWVEQLQALDYQVWLQDGAGTQALTASERRAYFDQINCKISFINEAFVQTSTEPFKARAATPEELAATMAQQQPCHQRILFSLRYLPQTAGLLYLTDVTQPAEP